MDPTFAGGLTLVAAAAGAGAMNALAGGGTILTYPALVFAGADPIVANATSTVALLPGAAASMAGYRKELKAHRQWLRVLLWPSLIGGAIGSGLVLLTPPATFAALAPWLVLFATALFAVQGLVARRVAATAAAAAVPGSTAASGERTPEAASSPAGPLSAVGLSSPHNRLLLVATAQTLVAIYGGYFGAGMGIMMLALLGFLGLSDIHGMNGIKNGLGLAINSTAAALFLARGVVDLPIALMMAVGAAIGGYGGARFARHIGRAAARRAVVVVGLLVAALLLAR